MRAVTFLDSQQFRKDVREGIRTLAEIVQVTLGPGGRTVMLEQENGSVLATKDGVTVAKHFAAQGPVQRLVAQAAVEASERTVRSCGDGTTTSLVLANAIVEAGHEYLYRNPSASPQQLARELKEIFNSEIIPMIDGLSKPIRDLDIEEAEKAIWHVAMVSANFDESIANAVTKAVNLVGTDGMVFVEEGAGGLETTVQHSKGFPFNSGLADLGGSASASFVNRKAYGDCVLNGAYVALYDGEIHDIETVAPLMQAIASEQDENGRPARRPIVVIAHGFGDMVLRIFSQNFRQNALTIVPVITPRNGQANGRQAFLYDMLAYTSGNVFDPQGNPLSNAMPSTVGFVEEVRIGVSESVFITEPDEDEVRQRIDELKKQMENASEFDQDKTRYRIGRLTGGVATIFAGGATALEAKERRDRVVDAVSAVRSALDSGVVPGGGSTLLHISRKLSGDKPQNQIFAQALARPFTQILMNAGVASNMEEALFTGNGIGQKDSAFMVYDALKRQPVEFWSSGIFDPTKVTKNALQNALSVAQLLMTCGGAIARQASEGEEQVMAMQRLAQSVQNGEM